MGLLCRTLAARGLERITTLCAKPRSRLRCIAAPIANDPRHCLSAIATESRATRVCRPARGADDSRRGRGRLLRGVARVTMVTAMMAATVAIGPVVTAKKSFEQTHRLLSMYCGRPGNACHRLSPQSKLASPIVTCCRASRPATYAGSAPTANRASRANRNYRPLLNLSRVDQLAPSV